MLIVDTCVMRFCLIDPIFFFFWFELVVHIRMLLVHKRTRVRIVGTLTHTLELLSRFHLEGLRPLCWIWFWKILSSEVNKNISPVLKSFSRASIFFFEECLSQGVVSNCYECIKSRSITEDKLRRTRSVSRWLTA